MYLEDYVLIYYTYCGYGNTIEKIAALRHHVPRGNDAGYFLFKYNGKYLSQSMGAYLYIERKHLTWNVKIKLDKFNEFNQNEGFNLK